MEDYGLPYGRKPRSLYGLDVALPPTVYALPRPPVPFVAPPVPALPGYGLPGATPRMVRQIAPMATALAGVSGRVADVLPFPAVQAFAGFAQDLADEGQKAGAPKPGRVSVTPEQLTAWVKRTESSGNYTALNRQKPGNTASGAYQYTDRTWNGYGGYAKAMYAPREVQDRRFAEDIAGRMQKYGGDPFKAIAAHYLPAYANNPAVWQQRLKVGKDVVDPIATYVRKVIRGTPLEAQFNGYLARHQDQ